MENLTSQQEDFLLEQAREKDLVFECEICKTLITEEESYRLDDLEVCENCYNEGIDTDLTLQELQDEITECEIEDLKFTRAE